MAKGTMTVFLSTQRWCRLAILTAGAIMAAGCASTSDPEQLEGQTPQLRSSLGEVVSPQLRNPNGSAAGASASNDEAQAQAGGAAISIPEVAERVRDLEPSGRRASPPRPAVSEVSAAVPSLVLPDFIDAVFGSLLEVPYVTGPGVVSSQEVIQINSSGVMPAGDFLELVTGALRTYGVVVEAKDGFYNIVREESVRADVPRFIRSRSLASVPKDLRPVIQFVDLKAISANEMMGFLDQALGDSTTLVIEANPRLNALTLTGLPNDIQAALKIVSQLDELTYAGTQAYRYEPVYWPAPRLADELNKLLAAEGWQVSANTAVQRPILILPIEYSNNVFVFSRFAEGLARARYWMSQLDRAAQRGDERQLFIYEVQNVDASIMAETVQGVLASQNVSQQPGSQGQPQTGAPTAQTPGEDRADRPGAARFGRLSVDVPSNQLIFSGTPAEYQQIRDLLVRLDKAPPEVLIEVTVAEIRLTDDNRFGVEFIANNLGGDNLVDISNNGLGLGSDGFDIVVGDLDVNATLTAFAKNELVNILSTPHLTARSGGSAQIQVGSDVPVITSQRAASTQDGVGATDVLQSVEFRSTGVLLSIEPLVFGDNRVDLNITQEVSTAIPTTTSTISSPTISNRSITTQLSLEEGKTAILGGLIQSSTTESETGTPFLKDLPGIGNLFKSSVLSQEKTELIVLITAYVLRGDDKQRITDELLEQFERTQINGGDRAPILDTVPLRAEDGRVPVQ